MTMKQIQESSGMRTFFVIWSGQLISLLGSGLTHFALGVWIYDQTGQATPFALTILFGAIPAVLIAPLAGVVADRVNRRLVMILTDTGAILLTLAIVLILSFVPEGLQIWHIYLVSFLGSILGNFQWPAWSASVTMLVPKKHFGRASGLMQTSQAIRSLLTPLVAGILYAIIGLEGIILIDFVSCFFAVGALLIVRIPQPKPSSAGTKEPKGAFLKDLSFGWSYLRVRTPLMVMLFYYALVNFLLAVSTAVFTPMILSFSSVSALGVIQTVGGAGLLIGSLLMSSWGGPKRKMYGVYGFIALFSLGFFAMGLLPSAVLAGAGMFVLMLSLPLAAGCSQVIWMTKVAPDIQGRVFSIRGMLANAMSPLAYLIAGPLADRVFGPLMAEGGNLAGSIGRIIGVGADRGIGLMHLLSGLLMIAVTTAAYAYPRLRYVEDELPDAIPDEEIAEAPAEQPKEIGDTAVSPT